MRVSSSSTSSGGASNTSPLAASHTIQSRWQFSAYHTGPPFSTISFKFLFFLSPTQSPGPLLPTQPASIRTHRFSNNQLPRPTPVKTPVAQPVPLEVGLPPGGGLRYDPPGRPYHSTSTTIHAAPSGPPIPQSVGSYPRRSRSLPSPPRRDDPIFGTQLMQTAPTPTCAFPLDGRSAACPTTVLISLAIACTRQRGMALGLGGGACELRRARSAAIGWEMRMTSTRRIYFVDHNTRTTM